MLEVLVEHQSQQQQKQRCDCAAQNKVVLCSTFAKLDDKTNKTPKVCLVFEDISMPIEKNITCQWCTSTDEAELGINCSLNQIVLEQFFIKRQRTYEWRPFTKRTAMCLCQLKTFGTTPLWFIKNTTSLISKLGDLSGCHALFVKTQWQ